MDKQIQKAIRIFKNGGIVIFPTDTAIGIGCRIDNEQAVKRLFKIRKRPERKAVLALVGSLEMAKEYWKFISSEIMDKLIKKYWPGPLTLILHSDEVKVSKIVTGGTNTLGMRLPDNYRLQRLIKDIGVPILAPSANFSGEQTPFKFEDLNPELVRQADYVLNIELSGEKNVSTIIDCTVEPWKIIRQGAIKIQNSKFPPSPRLRRAGKIQNLVLLIDTADNKEIKVGLKINGKEYIQTEKITSNKTQIILPMIDKILKKYKLKPKELSEIKINTGPGSFTGLRVGIAIANALSFALKIPVNGKKVGQVILADY